MLLRTLMTPFFATGRTRRDLPVTLGLGLGSLVQDCQLGDNTPRDELTAMHLTSDGMR
jgi:hypothetical protein